MGTGKIITIIGFTLIFFYIIIQILKFYEIGSDVYGVYLAFYLFLMLSVLVLPSTYPHLVGIVAPLAPQAVGASEMLSANQTQPISDITMVGGKL
jgi:heme/copper-type cytochrome/quinol oxidase subunit 1